MTGYKSNALDSIVNKYLYFSDFTNLNDASESRLRIEYQKCRTNRDRDDRKKLIQKYMKGARKYAMEIGVGYPKIDNIPSKWHINHLDQKGVDDQIEEIMRNFSSAVREHVHRNRVCCFSRDNRSELMWGHYADGMKGVCVEIYVPDGEGGAKAFMEVEYSNDVVNANFLNFFEDQDAFIRSIHKYKSKSWEYEEEVRAIYTKEKLYLRENMFGTIILGFKCSLENVEKVVSSVRAAGVEEDFKIAYPSAENYGVNLTKTMDSDQLLALFNLLNGSEMRTMQAVDKLERFTETIS
ncbi:DUF2971 domain-containing protein [Salinicola socius]|uniref:DUF2971 domain-containing protein n=1 Tax=Salinicola socius TaxID=404433 RepID=UPI001300D8E0|nr:DUF2971 domain-containing protein [Salinicola socius]